LEIVSKSWKLSAKVGNYWQKLEIVGKKWKISAKIGKIIFKIFSENSVAFEKTLIRAFWTVP